MGRFLSVFLILMSLSACFESEEEKAVNIVREGYLSSDKSSTVGGVLEGYHYFNGYSWDSFETSQGRRIVEFVGNVDLSKNREDFSNKIGDLISQSYNGNAMAVVFLSAVLETLNTGSYIDAVKKYDLTMEVTVQFQILPDKAFEVAYFGRKLASQGREIIQIPESVLAAIKGSETSYDSLLDDIYDNEIVIFPGELVQISRIYKKNKNDRMEQLANVVDQETSSGYLRSEAFFQDNEGRTAALFEDEKNQHFGVLDASTEQISCSVTGEFSVENQVWILTRVFDTYGEVDSNPQCQMKLSIEDDGTLSVETDCEKEYCGMNGYLSGNYGFLDQQELVEAAGKKYHVR